MAHFSHQQGNVGSSIPAVTTINIVLGANPTPGNMVCVGFTFSAVVNTLTLKDANNNSYVITPNSPVFQSSAGGVWMAYLLSAPANASATLTATWVTSATVAAWADEFSVVGTAVFDKDVSGNSASSLTTINLPVITPTNPQSLLYACAASGGTISAPIANAVLGVWTGSAGAISQGDMAEYVLNGPAVSTAVNFTQSSAPWSAMAMAFFSVEPALVSVGCVGF